MSRHPYTYACDFIRESCQEGFNLGDGLTSTSMSRATASTLCKNIAAEIGMTHKELATVLSHAYQKKHGITL